MRFHFLIFWISKNSRSLQHALLVRPCKNWPSCILQLGTQNCSAQWRWISKIAYTFTLWPVGSSYQNQPPKVLVKKIWDDICKRLFIYKTNNCKGLEITQMSINRDCWNKLYSTQGTIRSVTLLWSVLQEITEKSKVQKSA